MFFDDNPFYILGLSCSADRRTIIEKAEELAFADDANAEKYEEAKNILLNPKRRLEAEIGWFPGIKDVREICLDIKYHRFYFFGLGNLYWTKIEDSLIDSSLCSNLFDLQFNILKFENEWCFGYSCEDSEIDCEKNDRLYDEEIKDLNIKKIKEYVLAIDECIKVILDKCKHLELSIEFDAVFKKYVKQIAKFIYEQYMRRVDDASGFHRYHYYCYFNQAMPYWMYLPLYELFEIYFANQDNCYIVEEFIEIYKLNNLKIVSKYYELLKFYLENVEIYNFKISELYAHLNAWLFYAKPYYFSSKILCEDYLPVTKLVLLFENFFSRFFETTDLYKTLRLFAYINKHLNIFDEFKNLQEYVFELLNASYYTPWGELKELVENAEIGEENRSLTSLTRRNNYIIYGKNKYSCISFIKKLIKKAIKCDKYLKAGNIETHSSLYNKIKSVMFDLNRFLLNLYEHLGRRNKIFDKLKPFKFLSKKIKNILEAKELFKYAIRKYHLDCMLEMDFEWFESFQKDKADEKINKSLAWEISKWWHFDKEDIDDSYSSIREYLDWCCHCDESKDRQNLGKDSVYFELDKPYKNNVICLKIKEVSCWEDEEKPFWDHGYDMDN